MAPTPAAAAATNAAAEAAMAVSNGARGHRPLWKVCVLFGCHATCSVVLTLLNKTIATGFGYTCCVVFLQNCGTLFCSFLLHLGGGHQLRSLRRHQILPLAVDAIWLIVVLWSSLATLELVSVPMYVVVRNTVPFLTALCERAALGRALDTALVASLLMTFAGTVLYSISDLSGAAEGLWVALGNAGLVATMCVYEGHLMKSLKAEMSPVDLNFHRVLLSMPGLLVLMIWREGFPGPLFELADRGPQLAMVSISSIAAFAIGTLLFELQAEVSATTIQVVNVGYKCVTTAVSRLTHPSEVLPLGYLGYGICTCGCLLYTLTRPSAQKRKPG